VFERISGTLALQTESKNTDVPDKNERVCNDLCGNVFTIQSLLPVDNDGGRTGRKEFEQELRRPLGRQQCELLCERG
jgi:hypothetical protein